MGKNDKQLIIDTIKELEEIKRKEEEQARKKRQRRTFHNTELLMKNYKVLRQHSQNAVFSCKYSAKDSEAEEEASDIEKDSLFKDGILYIDAILTSKARTAIMLEHIDIALDILRHNAERKGKDEENKYMVMTNIFIHGASLDYLAEEYHCTTMTLRRWKNEMINQLGVLLFGIDALFDAMNTSC